MRTWLWEFMAKWGREWGMVQDAYWWNVCAIPEAHAIQGRLMRPSVKPCVWLGLPDCYRDQEAVRWSESEECKRRRMTARAERQDSPSGHGANRARSCGKGAAGVTPFNVLPFPSVGEEEAKGSGHAAMTPKALARWWVRYLCPPAGVVLDPFLGSGTVAVAALCERRFALGIEKEAEYVGIARGRIAKAMRADKGSLFADVQ
jgi:DNA modification methylase